MPKLTYPVGYAGARKNRDQLNAWGEWQMLAPEFRRRLVAMFDACPNDLGIGGGGRSRAQQEALFRSRYYPCTSGIYFDGQRWCRRSGVASAAPPGSSFHEDVPELGGAIAADLIGDIAWAGREGHRFGLKDFSDVNSEPWHFQPSELPNGRSTWVANGRPQMRVWALPGSPVPQPPKPPTYPASTPVPTLRLGSRGVEARQLIDVLKFWGWYPRQYAGDGNDGIIGQRGDAGIEAMQRALKTTADGVYGPGTARLYTAFVANMSALARR